MVANRLTPLFVSILLLVLALAPVAKASSFSFSGMFQQDDNVQLFGFALDSSSAVNLETFSYGGGTNAAGQVVPSGGFSTLLSLYNGSGGLIDFALGGGCPPQHIDPVTGLCGDTVLTRTLASGSYIVAITEYFNAPNGLNVSNGFVEGGQGNFTGPLLCGVQGGFLDPGCNKRNGNFELDIVGVTSATAIPEPSSICGFVFGSALLGFGMFSRQTRKFSKPGFPG